MGALGQPAGAQRVLALPADDPDPVHGRTRTASAAAAPRPQELTALVKGPR